MYIRLGIKRGKLLAIRCCILLVTGSEGIWPVKTAIIISKGYLSEQGRDRESREQVVHLENGYRLGYWNYAVKKIVISTRPLCKFCVKIFVSSMIIPRFICNTYKLEISLLLF